VVDSDVPDADVVVATWWETAEWVWQLSPTKGSKAYFIQHYEDWGGPPARVDATWRLPMHKIVVSRWLEHLARKRFGATDVSYVPNAVDLHQFDAPARGKSIVPTVGFMYSPLRFKGSDIATAAVNQARRAIPSLRVRSFGSVQPEKALPLPDRTEFSFFPKQEQIRDVYAACDAWLFASRTEGFGLPLLEAMACRTPIIATPAGAAPELLAQGGGVLLGAADPGLMASALVKLCSLPDREWRAVSVAARDLASRFRWEDSVRQFEAALEIAIARRDGAPCEQGFRLDGGDSSQGAAVEQG
jgi:glycosyltransferase involved in cell wall biosynthesis